MGAPFSSKFQIGIICPLAIELAAVAFILDKEYDTKLDFLGDDNTYRLGRIGPHHVVIAGLPGGSVGTNTANTVGGDLTRSFPSVKILLLVGIGGGVPGTPEDVRLGDIVVSQPASTWSGVVCYDTAKAREGEGMERIGFQNPPPRAILSVLKQIQANHILTRLRFLEYVKAFQARGDFRYPGVEKDILFKKGYKHIEGSGCQACDKDQLIPRQLRPSSLHGLVIPIPKIHYGIIASGDKVLKDSVLRDKLSQQYEQKILCFEMEAAGLMNAYPCLVIRGVSDYCDSHTHVDDPWHGCAAAMAAAYAKELILEIPVKQLIQTAPLAIVPITTGEFDHDQVTFIGRKDLMAELDGKLKKFRRIALCGIGGAGKSTIASQISNRLQLQETIVHRLWLSMDSTGSFSRDLEQVAGKMGLKVKERTDQLAVRTWIHHWLQSPENGSWVIVIDGFDSYEGGTLKDPQQCFPNVEHGRILLTTRSEAIGTAFATFERCIKIPIMSIENGRELLHHLIGPESGESQDGEAVKDLVDALDCLPLAISHAAAYIRNPANLETVSTYLATFKLGQKAAEERFCWARIDGEGDSTAPFRTLEPTLNWIECHAPKSARLLYLIGCFDAQRVAITDLGMDASLSEIKQMLQPLTDYCVVSINQDRRMFSMHKIVQSAILYRLDDTGHRLGYQLKALLSIKDQFDALDIERQQHEALDPSSRNVPDTYMKQKDLLRHFEIFCQYANSFERPAWLPDMNEEIKLSILKFANLLRRQGKLGEAERLQRAILITRGSGKTVVLMALKGLASTLRNSGTAPQLKEACKCCLAAEKLAAEINAPMDLILEIRSLLALAYSERHKFERAIKIQQDLIKWVQSHDNSPRNSRDRTMEAMSGLAMIHYLEGELHRNRDYFHKCLKIQLEILKERQSRISVRTPWTNLDQLLLVKAQADVMKSYYSLAAYDVALPIAQTVVASRKRLLGADDCLTLDGEHDLALVYRAQGCIEGLNEALKMQKTILSRQVAKWGSEHETVRHSAKMLWITLYFKGQDDEARDLAAKFRIEVNR